MGRCGLDDAGWREVLERAPRVTAAELPGAAGDMAVEVVRLVRHGHDAGALVAEWCAALAAGVRPLVEPDAAALGEGLAALVARVKGPEDLPAAVAWVDEFTARFGERR